MNKANVFLIFSLLLGGCAFVGLHQDVKKIEAAAIIKGNVHLAENTTLPIIVTLNRSEAGKNLLEAYAVVYGASDFIFSVTEGDYFLFAFEDANQDFALQTNERAGWYGSPSVLSVGAGQRHTDIALELLEPSVAKKALPGLFVPGIEHEPVNLTDKNLGKVVDLSFFKQSTGPLGMWDPVKFHLQGHTGIYFLEEYHREKTPVLLIHGISGSGHDWRYLIDRMDRTAFQPWIVQYPSGMRLDLLSQSLSQSVNELRTTYNMSELFVVAHSMGGLVARGFINHQSQTLVNDDWLTTFISISTPWSGHTAAKTGVKHAPVAVPSWFDMVPGSPYLAALHTKPLPKYMDYYLMFGHKGDGINLFGGANTDGTVTLRSQLSPLAQNEAVKVIGYDEDHIGILNNADVAARLDKILKRDR